MNQIVAAVDSKLKYFKLKKTDIGDVLRDMALIPLVR